MTGIRLKETNQGPVQTDNTKGGFCQREISRDGSSLVVEHGDIVTHSTMRGSICITLDAAMHREKQNPITLIQSIHGVLYSGLNCLFA